MYIYKMAEWKKDLVIHSFEKIELKPNKKGDLKKNLIGQQDGWNKLIKASIKKGHKAFGLLTGEINNIIVIDFDDISLACDMMDKYTILDEVPRVATRKGFHFYFKWSERCKNLPSSLDNIDIQGNKKQVLYPPTQYVDENYDMFEYMWDKNEDEELIELPDDIYNMLMINETEKKEIKIINNEPSNITEENIEIAELMSVEDYLLNYNEWTTTIWALKNAGFSYDFANKLSKKVNDIDDTKYDENALEELWDKGKEGVGLGTIYRQAKESNKKQYYKIKIKYLPKQIYKSEDYSLAKILVDECFNDRLVYCDGSLMTYTNKKWYADNDFDYLKYMISNDGVKYFSEIEKLLLNYSMCLNQDDDEYETIRKNKNIINDIISLLGKLTWKNNISKEIKSIVINKHQKIEFNNNGYDFAFDNTKYNFKTEKFEDIERTDYISYSAGYDYKEPEEDQTKLIKKLIEEIFPNEDIRKCYMSIMRTAFMGYTKDKFIVANGNGGNGKGLLNELLLECVGDDYGYTGNIGALTDKKKTGSNPEIANLNKKRFCIFKEPNQKEKILLGNVKELVDNKEINARQNYSNNTKVRLQATFILECNKKLAFDGEVNESEYRRFIDVLFESTFTTNKKLLDDNNLCNVYEANADYKQDEFKENYRCALFKYIIDNAEKQIIIPECVAERTKEYIDSNDELLEFMKDNYIYEPEKNDPKKPEKNDPKILQVKDVFNLYKNSEYYERLYKKERPTYKTFCNSIKEHASYKHFYYARKKINGVSHYSILIGHKIIPEEEKKEEEEKKKEEED